MKTDAVPALDGTPAHSRLRRLFRWLTSVRRLKHWLPWALNLRIHGRNNRIVCRRAQSLWAVRVTVNGSDNTIEFDPNALVHGTGITVNGDGNVISIGSSRVHDASVVVRGDANRIVVADGCTLIGAGFACEDAGSTITIGASTVVAGPTELAAIEGTNIFIGEDCLFSSGVVARTGDSHSLLDLEGRRVNWSADIEIGNHVWVGRSVIILKGAAVADSSVVGAAAVLTKRFDKPNSVIAGNPARVVREGIDWRFDRVPR